jgi:hypothetical protein
MKKALYFLLILGFSQIMVQDETLAQKVTNTDASFVAGNFIQSRNLGLNISSTEPFTSDLDTLAWIFNLQPRGFIVISSNSYMPPVIAWSSETNFGEGEAWKTFLPEFRYDLNTRNRFAGPGYPESEINRQKWISWMNPSVKDKGFKQWPAEGWSPTGGWLFTNWTQSAPYNNFCPIDGQSHVRSVAGCPATAMAQIVNYHHNLHQTRFTNDDDYYHNYGSGNQYWIDNDWASYGFPSWDQLNVYLDTLETHFQKLVTLSNDDKAALTFASGVAARQVYTSSGSGTFAISQAYDAFIRFGYDDSQLIYPSDTSLNTHLADNIKIGLPAHLGLVNPDETAGHNVVVDGYNTDNLYHFNFGWGGSANGWYTMPPTSIPYNLTVIEGIVLDINLSFPPSGVPRESLTNNHPTMYYVNETGVLRILNPDSFKNSTLSIYDISGRKLMCKTVPSTISTVPYDFQTGNLYPGVYFARLETENGKMYCIKFIR